MLKKLIPAAAIGALTLAAAAFGPADAAAIKLTATGLVSSAEPLAIQARSGKGGSGGTRSAGPRSAGPRSAGPRSSAPRFAAPRRSAAPSRSVAPRRAGPSRKAVPRHVAPRRAARPYRWSRDRRHRFYGSYFIVPFGYWLYADHPCYDWRYGSRGWGYYWNYARCPL